MRFTPLPLRDGTAAAQAKIYRMPILEASVSGISRQRHGEFQSRLGYELGSARGFSNWRLIEASSGSAIFWCRFVSAGVDAISGPISR
jgi:hypothetical protein